MLEPVLGGVVARSASFSLVGISHFAVLASFTIDSEIRSESRITPIITGFSEPFFQAG
jgi:hypothetical protein